MIHQPGGHNGLVLRNIWLPFNTNVVGVNMAVAFITTKLIPRQVWMFGLRCKQGLMIIRGASSARDIRKV